MDNPGEYQKEKLINSYKILVKKEGNESETGEIFKAAISLGKLPPSLLQRFEDINYEEEGILKPHNPIKSNKP